MNERYGLTAENMLAVLPQVLQNDEEMLALATAVAETLSRRPEENDLLRIYAEIDRLPEGVLDILAYDFKVDWWDGDYTLEQKRQTLKDSWRVHRMLGTKGAVEAAISPIYPETKVQEWYEYGGKPYFFKLLIDLTHVTLNPDAHSRILNRVNYYKNLRSHIEEIQYVIRPDKDITLHIGGTMSLSVHLPIPQLEDSFNFQSELRIGGAMAAMATIPVPQMEDTCDFGNTLRTGGRMASVVCLPIPALQDDTALSSTGRVGATSMVAVTIPPPEIQ